jgi:hypothetical protein
VPRMPIRMRTTGIVALALLAGVGCARRTSLMSAGSGGALAAAPTDKAVVVFVRPQFKGYAVSAAVYEDGRFIGIVMRDAGWSTRRILARTATWW